MHATAVQCGGHTEVVVRLTEPGPMAKLLRAQGLGGMADDIEAVLDAVVTAAAAQPNPWFIVGCMQCDYSGHTPSPPERCPNDGSILLRMDGLIVGHKVVEVARYMVRAAQQRADLDAASAKCNYANARNIIDQLTKEA